LVELLESNHEVIFTLQLRCVHKRRILEIGFDYIHHKPATEISVFDT
jgi:hypothetical protein